LEGHLILDLNPSIIFPIVDRLLGGGRDASHEYPNRALTEIELRLVSRITDLAIKGLENAWANICPLGLSVSQVESNPQLVQIVPPNEVVVLVSFEIIMGEIRGIMNLCIPFNTIEPLAGKLSSDTWSTYTKRGADARQRMNLDTVMSRAAVEMTVTLARTSLTTHELRNLCIGDIIMTEKDKSDGLEVMIEGRPLFLAAPGVIKGRKAIRIGTQIARLRDVVEARLKSHPPGQCEIA
jgi:flagellar motor switch protein FliM